jgi:hypothetical protein
MLRGVWCRDWLIDDEFDPLLRPQLVVAMHQRLV